MSRFSMVPSQQMRLEQRLTPQLIQSMEILQLPLHALEARIREELAGNPVLEELEPEAPAPPPAPDAADEAPARQEKDASAKEAEAFDRLEKLSREYEFDPGDTPYSPPPRNTGERDAKLDAMATTPSRGMSLQEHLMLQWDLIEAPEPVKAAGAVLIEWMDPDGYLRRERETGNSTDGGNGSPPLILARDIESRQLLMDEIVHSVEPPLDLNVLEEALLLVQSLDPPGVGAIDLTECLLIQLDAIPDAPPLTGQLVSEHLSEVAKHKLPMIAKVTKHSIEEINAAVAFLSKLHHHPGLIVSSSEVPTISPDIIVDFSDDGDGYTVRLARGNSPRLRISGQYRKMLEENRDDKNAREFIRKHLENATTLIDAIQFRRERLLQLAKVVVERQREFLDFGPRFIKVLRMRDLADEFGCDPSTISRTVDEKYLQTPRGIFPLRMFFTGGTETADGEEVSWDSLKMKVKEYIDQEDKRNPLADEAIAQRMADEGYKVSRRTVAKYRGQLGIPTSRERQVF